MTSIRKSRARVALDRWTHLAPAARKGKTKASFIARSIASQKASVTRHAVVSANTTHPKRKSRKQRKSGHPASSRAPHYARPGARAKQTSAPPERAEYAVSADYKARKRGSSITVQVAAIGPPGATKAQVNAAFLTKLNTGRSPRGWQIKIVDWRGGNDYDGGPAHEKDPGAWNTLSGPLALAELSIYPVGKG